jgi:hypothetical protein
MKKLSIIFLLLIFLLNSCKTKETLLDEMLDKSNTTIIFKGSFQNAVHPTSGTAKVITQENKKLLVFENFRTDPGPDLRVYLATSTSPTDFVEIGTLKASSGNFSYELDSNINIEQRNHVLIWCKRFSVLFGSAKLEK